MQLEFNVVQGALVPFNDDASDALRAWGNGAYIKCDARRPRNYQFHKKYFAMLDYAYDCWEPEVEYKGIPIQKNREKFRHDLQIAAGYYEMAVNIRGEPQAVPRSISFASMDDDEFGKLYNAVQAAILHYILKTYTADDLDSVVDQLMGFI